MTGKQCLTKSMEPIRYPPPKIKRLISGVNDLATVAPEIAFELISGRPEAVLAGSNKKVTWKCSLCSDEWSSPVRSRTSSLIRNPGCPNCNRKRAIIAREAGTLLKDDLPNLYSELRDPDPEIKASSHREVEWVCLESHVYTLSVNKKAAGRPCPYCSWRQAYSGFNTIADVRPDLVESLVNPDDAHIIANSKRVVEWRHKDNSGEHKWPAQVHGRVFCNTQCGVCEGRTCIEGINDWALVLRKTGLQWSPKNELAPTEISFRRSAYLECHAHDEPIVLYGPYKKILSLAIRCEICHPVRIHTSLGEEAVADFIALEFPELLVERNVRRFKKQGLYEIDIFVENSLAIHYDGTYWHQEGVFKPVGYHETRDSVESGLGLQSFVVEEASWTGDSEVVKERLREVLRERCPERCTRFGKLSK